MVQTLVIPANDHRKEVRVWITPAFPVVFVVFPMRRIGREPYDTFSPSGDGIGSAPHLARNVRLEPLTSNTRKNFSACSGRAPSDRWCSRTSCFAPAPDCSNTEPASERRAYRLFQAARIYDIDFAPRCHCINSASRNVVDDADRGPKIDQRFPPDFLNRFLDGW